MSVYAIIEHATGEWWSTPNGKIIWYSPGAAKNAWNMRRPGPHWSGEHGPKAPLFNEQVEFSCVPVTLTIVEEKP